jgi:branched-chain amino acid transport system substrate-binding protein
MWLILGVIGLTCAFYLSDGLGQEKRPYVLGAVYTITGPTAYLGDSMKTSVEMKVEQINKQGGIDGHPIKLIIYDAAAESTKAVMAAKRLIEQDKIDVLIAGGNFSGPALAIVPIVTAAEVPFMSVEGAGQIVKPVEKRYWVFKAFSIDEGTVGRTIDYWKKIGVTKVAMLSDTAGLGKSGRDELKQQAPSRGINVVSWEEFDPASNDLTPQLTRIRAANPELVLCWTAAPSGVLFMKNAKQLGMKQKLMHGFGFVGDRYFEMAGEASEGVAIASNRPVVGDQLPDSDPCKKEILAYKKSHIEKYGFPPTIYGAQGLDGLIIVVDALKRAKSFDKKKIRDAIENTKGLVGLCGIYNFSPQRHHGLVKEDVVVFEWRNKTWKLLMPAEY